MEELVRFLEGITGRVIEIVPEAIEGLIAMAKVELGITVILTAIIALVTLFMSITAFKLFYPEVCDLDGLWISIGVITAFIFLICTIVCVSFSVKLMMFEAAPEVYIIKSLFN